VFSHTALLSVCVALYPTGIFFSDIPFDDIYSAYFLLPGFHIMILGQKLSDVLSPFLFSHLSSRWASITGIVFIPGVIGLVLGGLQWYVIGRAVQHFKYDKPM
jgi:hypothetical protein